MSNDTNEPAVQTHASPFTPHQSARIGAALRGEPAPTFDSPDVARLLSDPEARKAWVGERRDWMSPFDSETALDLIESLAAERDRLRNAFRVLVREGCAPEAFVNVRLDRYDFAAQVADELGRDEPDESDELEGVLRLIEAFDAAMPPVPAGEGEKT